jgi:hypothetical protein
MTQNEDGSATAPTVPSHGSNIPNEETKMNTTEDSTGPAAAPVPTIDDLHREFEGIWSDLQNLQRKAFLLMGRIEDDLDLDRARHADGGTVTFLFQKRGIDVTKWLGGEVWADTADLMEKADKLYGRLEALQ